jgi:hypothetical protein
VSENRRVTVTYTNITGKLAVLTTGGNLRRMLVPRVVPQHPDGACRIRHSK